ncbi:MAG: beta-galactosidase [bacterium]
MFTLLLLVSSISTGQVAAPANQGNTRGIDRQADFFPVAVWLQDPRNAHKYADIGINLYVGLWRGPTKEQLDQLDRAGLRVVCGLNNQARAFLDRKTIAAWMHGDEPDNAQSLGQGKGYGPPILPSKIIEDYEKIRQADPSRKVILNLGQGVAWDGYYGRGVRTNHPEDYAEYAKGADIVSFDIYPAVHDKKEIAGNLWYVPRGVERLRQWTGDRKDVWCCIETTGISNEKRSPTPLEVRAEVWMAIIHGAKGIIYFAHQFKPKFIEAGLLARPEIVSEIKSINARVKEFAPVIHSTEVPVSEYTVESSNKDVPVAVSVRKYQGKTYVFAVAMRNAETDLKMHFKGLGELQLQVIGENRQIKAASGEFQDHFKGYEVHLYEAIPR